MKELFMNIAENITRSLTGLEGSTFTLWEFETYVRTLEEVKDVMNITCLVIIGVIAVVTFIVIDNKLNIESKVEA